MENMRNAFTSAVEYLSTQPKPSSIEEQRKRDFIKTAELSGWFDDEELELFADPKDEKLAIITNINGLNAQELRN